VGAVGRSLTGSVDIEDRMQGCIGWEEEEGTHFEPEASRYSSCWLDGEAEEAGGCHEDQASA
jgi:hypothetical protein